jgi:hypothetical protein
MLWVYIPKRGKGAKGGCTGCVSAATRRHELYVVAVLSGARVVRVLCVCVATPHVGWYVLGASDAFDCAQWQLTSPDNASTKRV